MGSRRVRLARRFGLGLLAFLGLVVAIFAVAYLFTPIPSPQAKAKAQGPVFYYADGKTPIAKTGVNRDAVPLAEVPRHIRDAVIATENRTFYEDPGVSVRGTARAFWSTVSGEQVQGGSTITQQMVRNYYSGLSQERSLTRKVKEVMVSLKVGREKSKDWILEQYLNTIYFGRDSYGIQAAAKAYYRKDVGDLTPAQGAFLAAAIQRPTEFADAAGERRPYAEQRWRTVVTGMVQAGVLTEADAAAMKFPVPVRQSNHDILRGQVGYMVNIARKELIERRGFSEDEINRAGLKIVTTFDKRLMDAAGDAVKSILPDKTDKNVLTGLVSVDPGTGQVVAMYGGRDYLDRQLSSSFGSRAQAASGFKPFVLAAALDAGYGLSTVVNGGSPQYFNGARIQNDSGTSYGMLNLVGATQNSVNTAYVNLGLKVGLDKVTDMAESLGIPRKQLTANGGDTAPTLSLGVTAVSPAQQAGAYAAFAAEGAFRRPYVVKRVERPDGNVQKFSEKRVRVFDSRVARDATYAMAQVVQGGTGTAANLPDGRPVAGKTGTGVQGRAIWFNGYIPQLATSVGIFRVDNKPLEIPGYSIYGGVLPAQIWRSYMGEAVAIKDIPVKEFGSPSVYLGGPPQSPSSSPSERPGPPTEGPESPVEPPEPSPPPEFPTERPSLPTRPPFPDDPYDPGEPAEDWPYAP
ncbi:transglycosylase domain-containing protein [Actinomadura craniellae]|uniref:transglycosylase domain-containing protein n=1 Tax=Actinomadura craniellae TaxID=2231787 RepID=UPI0013140422|nr:transglycosylase domain-containing protein [Actinomadura craniellae]